jgi:hypothetical protein
MNIKITLSSALLLSDDGGDFINETPSNQRTAEEKARIRQKHYIKKGDNVSFDNQTTDGVQLVETGTLETATAKK